MGRAVLLCVVWFNSKHKKPLPRARWPGTLGSWLAGHCPWVLVWAGACYRNGVGGFVFNSPGIINSMDQIQPPSTNPIALLLLFNTLHLRLPDGRPALFWVLVLVGRLPIWNGVGGFVFNSPSSSANPIAFRPRERSSTEQALLAHCELRRPAGGGATETAGRSADETRAARGARRGATTSIAARRRPVRLHVIMPVSRPAPPRPFEIPEFVRSWVAAATEAARSWAAAPTPCLPARSLPSTPRPRRPAHHAITSSRRPTTTTARRRSQHTAR